MIPKREVTLSTSLAKERASHTGEIAGDRRGEQLDPDSAW